MCCCDLRSAVKRRYAIEWRGKEATLSIEQLTGQNTSNEHYQDPLLITPRPSMILLPTPASLPVTRSQKSEVRSRFPHS